jgi:AcrR family transcriptional regulator
MTAETPTTHLSPEDFVRAALELVADGGLRALTLRSLGRVMDCDPTNLYRHFPSMAALRAAMVDEILLGIAGAELPDTTPRARIEVYARRFRTELRRYAELIPAVAAPDSTAGVRLVAARGLRLVAELDISVDQQLPWYLAFEGVVLGGLAFETAGTPDHLGQRRERLRCLDDPATVGWIEDDERVAAVNEAAFEHVLGAVLDACERAAARA